MLYQTPRVTDSSSLVLIGSNPIKTQTENGKWSVREGLVKPILSFLLLPFSDGCRGHSLASGFLALIKVGSWGRAHQWQQIHMRRLGFSYERRRKGGGRREGEFMFVHSVTSQRWEMFSFWTATQRMGSGILRAVGQKMTVSHLCYWRGGMCGCARVL